MASTAPQFTGTSGADEYASGTWTRKTLPFTWACWWYPTATPTGEDVVLGSYASASASGYELTVGDATGSGVSANCWNGGVGRSANYFSVLTNNTWHFIAAVFTSTTSRQAYRDGTLGTPADTGSVTVTSTLPNSRIACREWNGAGRGNWAAGAIQHISMWNVALTAAELNQMWSGRHPLYVRRDAMVQYLYRVDTTYRDFIGTSQNAFTLQNTPLELGFGPPVRPYRQRGPMHAY